MKSLAAVVAGCLVGAASANILSSSRSLFRPPPVDQGTATVHGLLAAQSTGSGTFDQLIDHNNPSLGTFKQKFWWSDEWWAGPGSPVVFFTPGEGAAEGYTGYLTNRTITGIFAEAIQGAVVMLEHRYWGDSSPFEDLTVENLQHLTLEQSIADTTYFAKNVKFPFDTNGSSNADKAPWVFSGGSYSGALSAWVESVDPGTFWAYHASSAVVEVISDFWQYFVPVQAGMPQNCSADISLVIDHVDGILTSGSAEEKQALKEKFGLGDLEYDDDFASALENGPWLWQSNQFYTGYSSFYEFCDYVENAVNGTTAANATYPAAAGVGLEKALDGYATWMRDVLIPGYCAGYGYWASATTVACFDTHNATSPLYTDTSVGNAVNRQWNWFLCNEPFDFWQDGIPAATPAYPSTLVSRLVDPEYWNRQCGLFFPPETGSNGSVYTYGKARGKTVADVNAYTGGWDRTGETKRLLWVNGQFDPWRDATVSSDFRPGGPFAGTAEAPVWVIEDGIHCSDLLAKNGEANAGVQAVIDAEVAQIKAWVGEWPGY